MQKKHHLNLGAKDPRGNKPNEQMNQKICEVAYSLYEKRNCVPGNELEDWLEAEKLVKQKLNSTCDK
ncbi:MAG: DUF2934 domain-containing protein [bacterium]|nr:DUF2934 domain-containing protein [bacterium]